MEIIETNLKFKDMNTRKNTNRIIVHHSACTSCTPEQIHEWHLAKGWAGAGYHFEVRKDGKIYRLRPEDKVGAHAYGANADSIGICFEGNFEEENMTEEQIKSGRELINYLKSKYNINKVLKHKDVCATACPGKNFPFDKVTEQINEQIDVSNKASNNVSNKTSNTIPFEDFTLTYQKTYNEVYGAKYGKLVEDGLRGEKTKASTSHIYLAKGSKNALVKWCQNRLINHKHYTIPYGADGIFGNGTENVVKQFQKDNHLAVDGIIGKNTIGLLF